ncbi:dienelactone hydrolase family protein [Aliifodinibius salicampi]|uniref:Dienelactone hydrolase family protein n=1 Tax=Fodinibius salicampi TaxID=1920655 RepID=A0ABT3Q0R0_9BACT|nr:dienelactone hydrolase family protein [Fodinibius salicampi]MCW9713682.1 dienelactone hydrolase family protein [Fodinibius salicampi]
MSLFRVDPENPFSGPHQQQEIITAGTEIEEAKLAMILIHGRGATPQSMLPLAREFKRNDIHFRALQAKRHTWYPRSFLAPKEMNQPGISSGLQAIHDQINELNEAGIPTNTIVLLGFSQGACLATEFAARHPQRYGGVVGLSGGLIGESIDPANYSGSLQQTPIFLGCSDRDPHIPQERVDQTENVFLQLEADVNKQIYKGMGHTVNQDEIAHVNIILNNI